MADEPTMWELKRAIESGYRELSGDIGQLDQRLSMYVLKEVYEAQRKADLDRIARLEAQLTEQRTQTRTALLTAITSFIGPIFVGIAVALFLRGMG